MRRGLPAMWRRHIAECGSAGVPRSDVRLGVMKRARLLAITHDYSATGAPIVLFNILTGLTAEYEILVAGQGDGPLRARYSAAGIAAVVQPNLLNDANLSAQ